MEKSLEKLTEWLKVNIRKDYFEMLSFYNHKEPVTLKVWFDNVKRVDPELYESLMKGVHQVA